MLKITSITQQKKLRERVSLFVDGKFEMGIDSSLVIKYDLKVGDTFSDALKHDLENDDHMEMAYLGVLNFIAFRERCEHEVHEWLFKKQYIDLEEELLTRLKDRNYLNDERFASLFVRDRVKIKGWGPNKLRQELNSKRIEKNIIEAEIEAIRKDFDFFQIAAELAQRRLKHIAAPTLKDKKRLWSLLQRRGFETPTISQVMSEFTFILKDENPS
ncbi:MAG: RecX family transcriptional regulator [Candidatus Marinimicrobia bacterium]|nr:RecX family transcriptional regulator [Candidatus Neomarinimicrobiota bacterium]